MNPRFNIVTIVGVGLLGGSLGLALKQRGIASAIRGVGHRQSSLDKALEVGAVDSTYLNAAEAADAADLIVICTPAALVPQMMDEVLPACSHKTAVTDVASTKAQICAHAAATWPKPSRFVGSHPMAGSERSGPEHADAGLYDGSVTLVEQGGGTLDSDAHQAVVDLWRGVGAEVIEIEPEAHDAILSRTSHIPHIVAACIAILAARQGDVGPFVGRGFRDVTRIAASRPEVWRDICLTNRDNILQGLDELLAVLADARHAIVEARGDVLGEFFCAAREAHDKAAGE